MNWWCHHKRESYYDTLWVSGDETQLSYKRLVTHRFMHTYMSTTSLCLCFVSLIDVIYIYLCTQNNALHKSTSFWTVKYSIALTTSKYSLADIYIERILHGGAKIWILSSSNENNILRMSKRLFSPQEDKIHIFKPPCNFHFII